ncbi:beta-lactamase family protein [candidate division KSB1 bacterium]|nr:beta-lactamase family protein [candidate division KSB1 bacterium]
MRKINRAIRVSLRAILIVFILIIVLLRGLIWFTERSEKYSDLYLPSCESKTENPKYLNQIQTARRHLFAMMKERDLPSASIAVSKNGKIIWTEAFGYADLEKRIIACPSTQYRIQSVSKPLSALAMAKLYDHGKLDIDEDIRRYVPEFTDKGYKITPRLLATHRSGIRNYRDDFETLEAKNYDSLIEGLNQFIDDPLEFVPGERFQYSTFNYWLLNAVIERASTMPFQKYMQDHIFRPLGMTLTTVTTSSVTFPNQAHCYDNVTPYSTDGSMVNSPPYPPSYLYEISTAEDLVRFANSLSSASKSGLIKEVTQEMLFEPRSRHMFLIGYGMGWMSARDLHLRKAHFHFGAGSGGTSFLIIFPEQNVNFAILSNLGHAKFPFERLMGIANPFLYSPTRVVFNLLLFMLFAVLGIRIFKRNKK